MASAAPATSQESDSQSGLHTSPYHLPNRLPGEPQVGDHILYADHGTFRHALVQVVFPEHGMPEVTLVLVRPGNQGLQTKRLVPHKTRATNGAYWCRPEEQEEVTR